MTASEKTLNDYINCRIIDKIYIPRDIQAMYDFNALKNDVSIPADKTDEEKLSSRMDALKSQIKASCDCITLRSLKQKEYIEIGSHLDEFIKQLKADNPDKEPEELSIPFKEQFNTHLLLRSLVSVKTKDDELVNAQDRTIDEWLDYLEGIQDGQPSSFALIIEKLKNLRVTTEQEQATIEDLDFLD